MPKRVSNAATGSGSAEPTVTTATAAPAVTAPAPSAPDGGDVSRYQRFTTDTIHRTEIKNATYNPRHITEQAKKRLRDALSKVGLVQPIVWNRRSGNIVGGHQRIKQLDALEGGTHYRLTVAVVDVDDVRERELNILLNNPEAQGDWDLDALKKLLDTEGLALENTGFALAELMQMFGEAPTQDTSHVSDMADQLAGVKDAYDKLAAASRSKDDSDFYCVVVFGSVDERARFLEALELPDNKYVNGDFLTERLKLARGQLGPEETKAPAKGQGVREGDRVGENEAEGSEEKG